MNNVPQLYTVRMHFSLQRRTNTRELNGKRRSFSFHTVRYLDCITSKVKKPNKSSKHTAVDFREIEKERVEHICNIIELLSTATDTKSKAKQAQFIHS
jgi:hypothetical protein